MYTRTLGVAGVPLPFPAGVPAAFLFRPPLTASEVPNGSNTKKWLQYQAKSETKSTRRRN